MYIESFGNPRNFSRLARRLTRVKPVVAVKARRLSDADGSIGDATEDALLRQTGVLRVPTLAALVDTARLLLDQPLPAGRRVAVLGNAGGSLAIAADAVLTAGARAGRPGAGDARRGRRARRCPDAVPGIVDLGPHAAGPRRGAGHRRARRRPRGRRAARPATPRASAPPPTRRSPRSRVGRKVRPEVPVVVCAYGPRRHAVGRGAGVRRHRRRRRRPRSGGRLRRVAGPARGRGARRCEEDRLAAARQLVQEQLDAGHDRARRRRGAGAARRRRTAGPAAPRWPADVDEAAAAAASMGYPVVLKAAGRAPTAKTAAAGLRHRPRGARRARASRGSGWRRASGDALIPALVQPMVAPGVDVAVARPRPPHGRSRALDRARRRGRRPRSADRRAGAARSPTSTPLGWSPAPGWRRRSTTPTGRRWRRRSCGWPRSIEEVPEVGELTLNPRDRPRGHGGRHPGPGHDRRRRARPAAAGPPSLSRACPTLRTMTQTYRPDGGVRPARVGAGGRRDARRPRRPEAPRRHPQGRLAPGQRRRSRRRGRSPGRCSSATSSSTSCSTRATGGTLLAACRTGHLGPTVFRSTDLGRTWAEASQPAGLRGGRRPRSIAQRRCSGSRPGHADEPGVWYAGGSPQGLFRTDDGGDTWAPVAGWNDHPRWGDWAEWPDARARPTARCSTR